MDLAVVSKTSAGFSGTFLSVGLGKDSEQSESELIEAILLGTEEVETTSFQVSFSNERVPVGFEEARAKEGVQTCPFPSSS